MAAQPQRPPQKPCVALCNVFDDFPTIKCERRFGYRKRIGCREALRDRVATGLGEAYSAGANSGKGEWRLKRRSLAVSHKQRVRACTHVTYRQGCQRTFKNHKHNDKEGVMKKPAVSFQRHACALARRGAGNTPWRASSRHFRLHGRRREGG